MAKLTTKQRKSEPSSDFGMPGQRKYPMPDKSHAANAKARAKQMLDKGKLSKAAYNQIVSKANKVLGESSNSQKVKQAGSMMRKSAGMKG